MAWLALDLFDSRGKWGLTRPSSDAFGSTFLHKHSSLRLALRRRGFIGVRSAWANSNSPSVNTCKAGWKCADLARARLIRLVWHHNKHSKMSFSAMHAVYSSALKLAMHILFSLLWQFFRKDELWQFLSTLVDLSGLEPTTSQSQQQFCMGTWVQ